MKRFLATVGGILLGVLWVSALVYAFHRQKRFTDECYNAGAYIVANGSYGRLCMTSDRHIIGQSSW